MLGQLRECSLPRSFVVRCCSNADIDPAAEAGTAVNLRCGDRCKIRLGNDELSGLRLRTGAVLLSGKGLVAQRKLQAIVGGFQSRLLQRALQLRLLALQQLQRVGALDGHVRGHLTVAVDIELHIYAAQFRGRKPYFELIRAVLRAGGYGDRKSGDGNSFGRCGGRRCRSRSGR